MENDLKGNENCSSQREVRVIEGSSYPGLLTLYVIKFADLIKIE